MNELKAVRDAIAALHEVEKNLIRQSQPRQGEEVRNTLVDEQVDHNYRWKQKAGRDIWVGVIEYETAHTEGETPHSPYPRQEVLTDEDNNVDTLLEAVTNRVTEIINDGYTLVALRVQTYHVEGELVVEKVLNGDYEE